MEKHKTQNRGIKETLVSEHQTCKGEERTTTKTRSSLNLKKKSKPNSPSSTSSSSSSVTQTTKATTKKKLPKKKANLVSVCGLNSPGTGSQPPPGWKDSEIHLLQLECEELRNRLGCLREGLVGQRPSDAEKLMKQSQKELLWLQRQLSFLSSGMPVCILPASQPGHELPHLQPAAPQKTFSWIHCLEENTQTFWSNVTTLSQENHQWSFFENELKDVVREKNRLSLQYASTSHKALQYDQVKTDYDQLRKTVAAVTKERDLAVKEKHQLRAKLENLEQVLKHMREAAERRQQLELEHEQALAVLNAKQKEIELLQKAQVEAKKEHEGAVQLLETTLDSMQAKVRELEEKCRTQSEQFNLLSKELERFRQQAGKIDLLSSNSLASSDIPVSPSKSLSQLMNGIATSLGKGHESSSGGHGVISEYIRPLQLSGDKPEQLSIKPTFLSRSQSGSPGCRFESDMDNERNSNTSKQRYSGKVHLCIARYSYNPFDGPNENPEAELPLTAGKYLYVYGDMDEDGFYEGELLDGQRGLVPSNFVDFVQDNESRLSTGLSREQDQNYINHIGHALDGDGLLEINPPSHLESSVVNNGAGTLDVNIDEIGEDIVPYPRKITLIKQLAKSVIVGWEPPVVPPGWGTIHSYNVLVDKEIRMNVSLGSRTKALIEKLNIATCTYRISIQSITSRGNSDELQCTLLVGKDVIVAPSHLKVDNVTQISAELTWLPTNSNYSHVIFLNEEEFDIVKAARYKYQFFNLKPNMAYKVKVLAKPHQMPWQLPLEQREKKEAFVEFSTLPAGPPAPPQDIRIQAGPTPGTILVSWKPPMLTATGTSNGATVTGYGVYAKGQRVAEVIFPTAENTMVELTRIRNLEAKEVLVRTLSAQGESVDSLSATIPPDLLVPPTPLPRPAPKSKPLPSAGIPDTKDEHLCPHVKRDETWEQARAASPVHGHTLEPPNFHSPLQGRRSPSPNRILPQPQGTPVPNTVAKAMAREAAQRVAAESNRLERRSMVAERSSAVHYTNSDEEEDGYDSPRIKRKGASVDDFLKGSELGKQPHYCHGEEYHTESSRGSDLSDIMEEDEEELYSEMQLEDGGRRRVSITSHNTLKECYKNKTTEAAVLQRPDFAQQIHHSKKLFSIPEVAEEDGDYSERLHKQVLGMPHKIRHAITRESRSARSYNQDPPHSSWHPAKQRVLEDSDEQGYKFSRSSTRSPDSGLDCGSEEEESRFGFRAAYDTVSATAAPPCCADGGSCLCRRTPRPLLARRRTLTRQSSIEEDFGDPVPPFLESQSEEGRPEHCERKYGPQRCSRANNVMREDFQGGWSSPVRASDVRAAFVPLARPSYQDPKDPPLLGNPSSSGRADRVEHPGRRVPHGGAGPQRLRTMLVPSIEITMDSNSEGARSRSGSEGNISPVKEEAYYRNIGGHRKWCRQRTVTSHYRYDGYSSRERLSPEVYEESETDPGAEEVSTRIFVALFDYDPLTMSPNPDAAEEELPFKEGQIIKVYGDKDVDGFYRGETCARLGLIPCNMVSEIQADDEEMMEQLLKQGFLPLNTPIEKIVNCNRFKENARSVHRRSRKSERERNRRTSHQPAAPTRRMVALYDYDPRESSPNVDVEAELTFCTGDIITVVGEIDEDGFYYGELIGQKGLVPSNFLEEVPDDVEVYLSDAPSRYAQDTPIRTKAKRVPPQNTGTSPRRAPSPTVHLHSGSPPSSVGSGSPGRGRELPSKKKKGLLSKGKKLLKRLGAVK